MQLTTFLLCVRFKKERDPLQRVSSFIPSIIFIIPLRPKNVINIFSFDDESTTVIKTLLTVRNIVAFLRKIKLFLKTKKKQW